MEIDNQQETVRENKHLHVCVFDLRAYDTVQIRRFSHCMFLVEL